MSEQIYTPFLTFAYLKHSFQKTETTEFDNKIVEIQDRSNEQVDTDIAPHITTPVPDGDAIFPACRTLALQFAKMIWADEVLDDMEKMEKYQDRYNEKLESVIKELMSRRTPQHESVLISKDPRSDKVILPSAAQSSFLD